MYMQRKKKQTVGERAHKARLSAGYDSAKAMAEAVQKLAGRPFTQQAMSKLESGQSDSSWAIPYIAHLTNTNAYWLASGKGEEAEGPDLDKPVKDELDTYNESELFAVISDALALLEESRR